MADGVLSVLARGIAPRRKALSTVDPNSRGWFRILESFSGAWQRNVTVDYDSVLSNHADFACKTLIASDIAKLRVKLVQRDEGGVWTEITNLGGNYGVLVKPNHFQTRIQFFESWMISKLQRGNSYVLIERDNKGGVRALYVLDPLRVRPMVADNGDVFYELNADKLSGVEERVLVPAREIIHDRFNCLHHPLVGVTPIFAAGLAASHGLAIQRQATKFFENGARPGGVLTAPGHIPQDTVERLKTEWEQRFTGDNAGKLAVLGDGLQYDPMAAKSTDSQLIEQLKWSAEQVCGVYHIPPYKIGIGAMPSYNNVQALNVEYYSQGLQRHIEDIELLLDEALGLRGEMGGGKNLGVELDLDGLLRMDSASQYDVLEKAKNVLTLNERRKKVEFPAIAGGDTIYMQQQDHSMEAIAARDRQLIDGVNNPPTSASEDGDGGANAQTSVKELFDTYGVGVRAGAITPQVGDERAFRELAGLPAPSGAVEDVWSSEPVRRPVTLKSVLDDPALAEPATVDDDLDEDKSSTFFRKAGVEVARLWAEVQTNV